MGAGREGGGKGRGKGRTRKVRKSDRRAVRDGKGEIMEMTEGKEMRE